MNSDQSLRYTLECHDLCWRVTQVEEQTSLARPPGVVVDASTDERGEMAEIGRMDASLLIEGEDMSRMILGWIRHVEFLGVGSRRIQEHVDARVAWRRVGAAGSEQATNYGKD